MTTQPHFRKERTLVILKPDGIQRSLVGEIISRFERVGLKLVGMKMMIPTREMVEKHYTLDEGWLMAVGTKSIKGFLDKGLTPPSEDPMVVARDILGALLDYLTAGPVVAFVLEGAHAVGIVRKLIGSTEPFSSDVGTIRGDYMLDSYEMSKSDGRALRNLVHASGSVKEAKDEIAHWFSAHELFEYRIVQEHILYDQKMDLL